MNKARSSGLKVIVNNLSGFRSGCYVCSKGFVCSYACFSLSRERERERERERVRESERE